MSIIYRFLEHSLNLFQSWLSRPNPTCQINIHLGTTIIYVWHERLPSDFCKIFLQPETQERKGLRPTFAFRPGFVFVRLILPALTQLCCPPPPFLCPVQKQLMMNCCVFSKYRNPQFKYPNIQIPLVANTSQIWCLPNWNIIGKYQYWFYM